jgi:hypothetical protein
LPRNFQSSKLCSPSCIECNFFHHNPGSSSLPSSVRSYNSFLFPHLSL